MKFQLGIWLNNSPVRLVGAAALDSFPVSLHNPNSSHLGCTRGLSVASENGGNSHRSHKTTNYYDCGNSLYLYLNQPITKGWCQPIGGHVSYATHCPNATVPGLCSSLSQPSPYWIPSNSNNPNLQFQISCQLTSTTFNLDLSEAWQVDLDLWPHSPWPDRNIPLK